MPWKTAIPGMNTAAAIDNSVHPYFPNMLLIRPNNSLKKKPLGSV